MSFIIKSKSPKTKLYHYNKSPQREEKHGPNIVRIQKLIL